MNKWMPKKNILTLIITFTILAILYIVLISTPTPTSPTSTNLLLPVPKQTVKTTLPTTSNWKKLEIRQGDSLARLFLHLGIHYQDLELTLKNADAKKYLLKIRPGDTLFVRQEGSHLLALKYPLDDVKTLYVYITNNQANVSFKQKPETISLAFKSFKIKHSLRDSAIEAGLTYKMYSQLTTIFKEQINYKKLKQSDQFNILYEEHYINNQKFHPGNIMAVEFTHGEEKNYAFRFTYPHDHTSYYSQRGQNLERSYLSSPVAYKRISGYFNYHRFDPYLHKVWPHLGIDYAASSGTPVHSISDGTVASIGRIGGYGKAVIVKYSPKYRVLYGHLSKFAPNLKSGEHIKKGQVLGYVGSTGWSTGPHLHYEVYVYGKPKDPLKIKFPHGQVVPRSYEAKFNEQVKLLTSELELYEHQSTL